MFCLLCHCVAQRLQSCSQGHHTENRYGVPRGVALVDIADVQGVSPLMIEIDTGSRSSAPPLDAAAGELESDLQRYGERLILPE